VIKPVLKSTLNNVVIIKSAHNFRQTGFDEFRTLVYLSKKG